MTQINNNSFDNLGEDSNSFNFDPTLPSFMKSLRGLEIPEPDFCTFISGTRHPDLEGIRCLTQALEPGAIVLPSSIPLLNQDRQNALSRTPIYGLDLVFQSEDRSKHVMVVGPTGAGKNISVLDMFRFSSLRDPGQTTITFSLKTGDYGPIEAACQMMGKKLVVVNLNDAWRSVGCNPLDTKFADLAYDRIRRFADAVKKPSSNDSEFWTQWIKVALKGAWEAGYRSFPAMFQLFSLPKPALIEELRSHGNACSSQLVDFLVGESHNAQTALASIIGALSCFLSENVRRVMSKDELNLPELLKQPVCLHIEMPETSLETQQVLYQMLARIITDELITIAEENPDKAHPATIFYDDMPSLGYLLSPNRLMTMRSRKIGVIAGVQSLASLELVYGATTRALIDNFHTKIILPGGPADDAAFFACASGEQMVGLPTFEGQHPTFINRHLLSAASIRTPSYKHPNFGMPATVMFGAVTFQVYLQRSYEHPSVARFIWATRSITGRERLRKRRLACPKTMADKQKSPGGASDGISNTAGWTNDQLRAKLDEVRQALDFEKSTEIARAWWDAFERENKSRIGLVLRFAEELAARKATITEFFLAYTDSGTDNIQGNLFYMDYIRIKRSEEAKRREAQVATSISSAVHPGGKIQPVLRTDASVGFEVVLKSVGSRKLEVIKVVKFATGASLLESKTLVESAPTSIGRARTRADAAKVVREIMEAGGQAHVV